MIDRTKPACMEYLRFRINALAELAEQAGVAVLDCDKEAIFRHVLDEIGNADDIVRQIKGRRLN